VVFVSPDDWKKIETDSEEQNSIIKIYMVVFCVMVTERFVSLTEHKQNMSL
jgi:hypothetical protein